MTRNVLAHSAGRRTLVALIVALSTAGCGTGSGGPGGTAPANASGKVGDGQAAAPTVPGVPLTPAERRMREQSQAFQRTVWEGAMLGTGSGLLMAILTGHELAVLSGAPAGGLAGSYVAHKQRQYSNKEDLVNAMIADVRKSNEETQSFITSVREVIAEDQRRLATVQQQVSQGAATAAELASARRRMADNRAVIAQAGQGARERHAMFQGAEREFRAAHPDTNTTPMQQQIEAFNDNIKTLDRLAQGVADA